MVPAMYRAQGERRIATTLALLILVYSLWLVRAEAALTATATVERCVGTSIDPHEPPGCARKLVAVITLSHPAHDAGSSLADADTTPVRSSSTTITHMVDHTTVPPAGSDPAVLALTQPFLVRVTPGPVLNHYPLVYVRDFHADMTEEVSSRYAGYACNPIVDPCGPYTRVDGTYVNHSNGLCCTCLPCALEDCVGNRLERVCRVYIAGSVCLRPSKATYAGYVLGAPALSYTLNVTIGGMDHDGATLAFSLSRAVPEATAAAVAGLGPSRALLTGAELGASGAPLAGNFTGYVFFTPSASTAPALAAAGADEWLLLEPSLVTLDGSECDRVGVSIETFNAQPRSQCEAVNGSCHRNQLADLRRADVESAAIGEGGRYMARYRGNFTRGARRRTGGTETEQTLVSEPPTRLVHAEVVWQLTADDLAYSYVPPRGVLGTTSACLTCVDSCGRGAAFNPSPVGEHALEVGVEVEVVNKGSRAGIFIVHLSHCVLAASPTTSSEAEGIVGADRLWASTTGSWRRRAVTGGGVGIPVEVPVSSAGIVHTVVVADGPGAAGDTLSCVVELFSGDGKPLDSRVMVVPLEGLSTRCGWAPASGACSGGSSFTTACPSSDSTPPPFSSSSASQSAQLVGPSGNEACCCHCRLRDVACILRGVPVWVVCVGVLTGVVVDLLMATLVVLVAHCVCRPARSMETHSLSASSCESVQGRRQPEPPVSSAELSVPVDAPLPTQVLNTQAACGDPQVSTGTAITDSVAADPSAAEAYSLSSS